MKYLKFFEELSEYVKKNNINQVPKYIDAMNHLTLDECVDHVIKNCKTFLEHPLKIRRHINQYNCEYFWSNSVDRVSRDNGNYYTTIIDNCEEWKEYPKRSHSFICTLPTESNKDNQARLTYIVIPYDNPMFGICDNLDIYFGFNYLLKDRYDSISYFFEGLNEISIILGLGEIRDSSFEDIKMDINKLQKHIYDNYSTYNNFFDSIPQDKIKSVMMYNTIKIFGRYLERIWGKNIFDSIISDMNPTKNNFKLLKYSELKYASFVENEIWVDSPCVFISTENMYDFLVALNKKTNKKINI